MPFHRINRYEVSSPLLREVYERVQSHSYDTTDRHQSQADHNPRVCPALALNDEPSAMMFITIFARDYLDDDPAER